MILHCEICSRMGTRLTTTSRIAKIKDGAKHPLKAEDFIAILGDRPDDERLGQLWMSGAPWDRMLHYNHHRPWANEPDEAEEALKLGGPQTIYVEDLQTGYIGKAKVTKEGIEIPRPPQRTREIQTDKELKREWNERIKQRLSDGEPIVEPLHYGQSERLVPPPMPGKKIHVRLRSTGKEKPRIRAEDEIKEPKRRGRPRGSGKKKNA